MLVLSRRRGEQIVIGANIELTVVDIGGNKVRLAVNAPRDVSIHRHEVYLRIQDEGRHDVSVAATKAGNAESNSTRWAPGVARESIARLHLCSRCVVEQGTK